METALRVRVESSVRAFIDQRRNHLEQFLEKHFCFTATFAVLLSTAGSDVIRHPLNFVLAIPFLFIGKISGWLDKFGFYEAAKLVQRLPTRIRTQFEKTREQQILSELLAVSDRSGDNALVQQLEKDGLGDALKRTPKLRACFEPEAISRIIASPLNDFSSTRLSILDLASSGLTIAVGYLLFGNLSLSPYDMGLRLADSEARATARSRFFLGPRAGSLFYHLFPPHPTAAQIATWSAAVIFGLGVLMTVIIFLSDPVQQWLGIHRRHLNKFLNACQDRLVFYTVSELQGLKLTSTSLDTDIAPFLVERAKEQPMPKPRSSLGKKVVLLRKQLLRMIGQAASRIEARVGRRRLMVLAAMFIAWGVATAGWIHHQRNPYLEIQELVEQKAYVTAVARLDHLRNKAKLEKEGEYWYWRGRALVGNGALDPAIDAYLSAILRNPTLRNEPRILHDAIDAVAAKNHEKSKHLILQEIGPAAIEPLLEKSLSREDINRWTLVDLARKLGGESKIRFDKVALADLAATGTCLTKKRAVEKVMEYRVNAAITELHDLEGQPQFKCLQPTLKQAIARLETPAEAR